MGHDNEGIKEQIIPFEPSTLETVDMAIHNFIDEKMNIFATTNKGFKKVPVKWVTAERIAHSKEDLTNRDLSKHIILPVISIERVGHSKNQASKGTVYAWLPDKNDERGASFTISRVINHDKTKNFANADSRKLKSGIIGHGQINFPSFNKKKKIVYQTITVPSPTYVQVNYKINLRSEYQQQMNEMLQPFIAKPRASHGIIVRASEHKYEAFIEEEYATSNNVGAMDAEERKFETTINIKVYAYLIGEDKNQEKPFIVKRENAVDIKFPREKVVFGDIPE